MIQEACERGLNTDERILNRLERIKRREMTRLLKAELRKRIRISEEEMRLYYQEKGLASRQEVKSRHIMVRTKEEAEEILGALKDGADFAQLARERSLDKVSAERGGDLGYWREGAVRGPTAWKIFSMEVGQISEPFKDPQGHYHVIEVLDKHPIGFEGLRPIIVNRLKEQKLGEVFREYMDGLEEKLGLKIEPGVVDSLFRRFRELGGRYEGFLDEEGKKVLARYGNKEVLLGEYLIWLEELKPGRSQLSDSSWVARSVERFAFDHVLVPYAAHKEKIDQSEWVQKRLEDMMVTELKRQEVDRKVITPEVVRAYYESHKERYYEPPKAVVPHVLLDSLRWAQEAYEKVKRGTDMADVAKDYPLFHNKYRSYVQFTLDLTEETSKKEWMPYIELVSKAEIGKLNEPVKLSFIREGEFFTGYAIFEVLERKSAKFEPLGTSWVRRDIERKLRIAEGKRIDELYEKWLIELRVTYDDRITIYQERLKSAELPKRRRKPVFQDEGEKD
jgi:parvulin-like peptidyl-prolyl isomerase